MLKPIKNLLAGKWSRPLAVAYSLLVTLLFLMPGTDLPGIDIPYIDKLVHVGIFLVLTVLWALSLDPRGNRSMGFRASLFIALLLYGMVIEFLQYALIDSRSADPADLMANLLGVLFGLLFAGLLRKRVGLKV